MTDEVTKPDKKRLLWLCRRGIREMDLLFKQYITDHYEQLNEREMRDLESLLNEADLDIIDWITGRKIPEQSVYLPMLEEMKALKQKQQTEN